MALKDNLNAVKEELSTEEQFLESVIKVESFYKKNKKIIISLLAAAAAALLSYFVYSYMQISNLKSSNQAYLTLLKNPNDKNAIDALKSNNAPLYNLYLFQNAVKSNNPQELEKIKGQMTDPILKDLANYQDIALSNGSFSNYAMGQNALLKNLAIIEEGYKLLKEGKKAEAEQKFSQIPAGSSLQGIVDSLSHYE